MAYIIERFKSGSSDLVLANHPPPHKKYTTANYHQNLGSTLSLTCTFILFFKNQQNLGDDSDSPA